MAVVHPMPNGGDGSLLGPAGGIPAFERLGTSLAALEQEVSHLWCETVDRRDLERSERLAALSHALRAASLLLGAEPLIGGPSTDAAHPLPSALRDGRPPLGIAALRVVEPTSNQQRSDS